MSSYESQIIQSAAHMMLWIYAVILGVALLIGLTVYVLNAVGMYRMAVRCGVKRPYLAFVPVANAYCMGRVAECGAGNGGKKCLPYRIILCWLYAAAMVCALVTLVSSSWLVVEMVEGLDMSGYTAEGIMNTEMPMEWMQYAVFFSLFSLIAFPVTATQTVFHYVALWHIYKLFDEKNGVLLLVLCIFVPLAIPIVLLVLGEKTPRIQSPIP